MHHSVNFGSLMRRDARTLTSIQGLYERCIRTYLRCGATLCVRIAVGYIVLRLHAEDASITDFHNRSGRPGGAGLASFELVHYTVQWSKKEDEVVSGNTRRTPPRE